MTLLPQIALNHLTANLTKWSNTLNFLSMFDHFVGLVLKELNNYLSQP